MESINRTCSIDGCNKNHSARGLCAKHYQNLWSKGLLTVRIKYNSICSVNDCNKEHMAKELCEKHYHRLRVKGSLLRTWQDPNQFVDCGDYWEIYLYDKDCNHIASAKIDPEDVEKCRQYKWRLDSHGYVVSGREILIFLHRLVMNVDSSVMVDHIYGDTLDNRKSQLRECNQAQNSQNQKLAKNNTSGEKNVYWDEGTDKWKVEIHAFNERHYFGLYNDFDQACQVAKVERDRLHGEFARDR